MTITIGSFSCSNLTAQPFGYDGEATDGLTSRTFRISGLLTPSQWSALLNVYNTWRNTRINDPDTLYANSVGTTVSLSITSTNTISVSNLACWFTDPPSGDQVGAYISATATLVDAAQALAVLLRAQAKQKERSIAEDSDVNCAQVTAGLQRQKDETDCELSALADGLADDFAAQALTREGIDAAAKAGVYASGATALAAIAGDQAAIELAEKQAQLSGRAAYAEDLAAADLDLELQTAEAQSAAYTANTATLASIRAAQANVELKGREADVTARAAVAPDLAAADLSLQAIEASARADAYAAGGTDVALIKASEAAVELADKEAALTARAAVADDIAAADLGLQALEATARASAAAANTSALEDIQAAAIATEQLEAAAKVAALTSGGTLNALRDARALQAIYDKYLGEDLPDLGTVTLGSVTVKLLRPMGTYSDGPQVAMTAGGSSLVTGPYAAHSTRRIEGILTSGTFDTLLSWYSTTIGSSPSPGTWFPTTAPTATAEKFIVNGAVATRYSVSLEVKSII